MMPESQLGGFDMAEDTSVGPIPADRRPASPQESGSSNAAIRRDSDQNNSGADNAGAASSGGDRVVITQDARDLSSGGGTGNSEANRAVVESDNNLTNRSSPLQENEPPNLTFRNLNRAPNPNDNDVEQALQENPVENAVRSSRVITENQVERVSAGEAVEQRNAERQAELSAPEPQAIEAPERGTNTAQNRIEAQETQAREQVVTEDATQEQQVEDQTREQAGGTNPTAIQSEIGQNLDDLV